MASADKCPPTDHTSFRCDLISLMKAYDLARIVARNLKTAVLQHKICSDFVPDYYTKK